MPKISKYPQIPNPEPIGSYKQSDVVFLLKNIGNYIKEQPNEERLLKMQSGTHYSQMLPVEYEPAAQYLALFDLSMAKNRDRLSFITAAVAETILQKHGQKVVLASLARAGTPAGILIARYLQEIYQLRLPHYSLSIIRDKGIDKNALIYILQNHPQAKIQFVDGWTGKGAISWELIQSIQSFQAEFGPLPNLAPTLAVLADPGRCADIYGTCDDFLIPNACLNSTVSGLISRTVYREELIGSLDFHGAKFYAELKAKDLSAYFIETIAQGFLQAREAYLKDANINYGLRENIAWSGQKEAARLQKEFGIADINNLKPGVGETTRSLLRRVPWKILVKDKNHPDIAHILYLAQERQTKIEVYPELSCYLCCALIK